VAEYDGIEYAEELRDYIFEKKKSCIFAFASPSKTGCKFIFHVEKPTSIEHYKELFLGIASDLDKFKGLDFSTVRCTQPLFCSWDSDAKYRENAVPSTVRGYKENAFVLPTEQLEIPENATDEERAECFRLITFLINRIVDAGHNSVISAAFTSGGLVSYYGINSDEMWDTIEDCIRNNDYLSKGTMGYLITAKTMFNKGQLFPTELRHD